MTILSGQVVGDDQGQRSPAASLQGRDQMQTANQSANLELRYVFRGSYERVVIVRARRQSSSRCGSPYFVHRTIVHHGGLGKRGHLQPRPCWTRCNGGPIVSTGQGSGRRESGARSAAVLFAIGGALCIAPASAQPADEFYKASRSGSWSARPRRRLRPLGRLLARHMPRHIPGNPNFVIENMPGAGTLVATNHLFNVAPRDGTAIGMVSRSMPAAAVMKVANVRFDPVKFNWIGSPEINHLVLYINNATAIKTPADLFNHELIVGATGLAQGITVGPSCSRTCSA